MITLDKTTRSLEAKLSGAVSTSELPVTVVYYDVLAQTKGDYSEYQYATSLNTTTGATEVTVCDAPKRNGTIRNIVSICIHNADSATATATVQINDNGTDYILLKAALSAGESLLYEGDGGWQIL